MRAFDKFDKLVEKQGIAMSGEIFEEDICEFKVKGHVFAQIEEDGVVTPLDLGKNFIVFEARLMIAQLMKFNFANGDKIVNGVTHMALGTGGPYQVGNQVRPFDLQNPPIPGVDLYNVNKAGSYDINGDGLSDLIHEVSRRPVTATYVDGAGAETKARSTIVDFSALFDFDDANGPLVEMAIFGGDNADQPKKGTMIAVKMFPVVNKRANQKLRFTWRLSF